MLDDLSGGEARFDRPPVTRRSDGEVIRPGLPLPHFNEVDEGVAVNLCGI